MRGALVEGIFAAAAADFDSRERDIGALEIECDAGASGGGEDAAPVGIGAGEGGFYQRRIRDGARDLLAARSVGAPRTSISITCCAPSPSSTICKREGHADEFQRGAEIFPVVICASLILRAPDAPLASSVTVSLVEVSPSTVMELKVRVDHGAQRARKQRGRNVGVGGEKAEHGGHIGLNHPRAFGAAEDANLFAVDAAFRGGPLWDACPWS